MSRNFPCRCGHVLGEFNGSDRPAHLHAGVSVVFIDLNEQTVTVRCPSCGHVVNVRARRIAMNGP